MIYKLPKNNIGYTIIDIDNVLGKIRIENSNAFQIVIDFVADVIVYTSKKNKTLIKFRDLYKQKSKEYNKEFKNKLDDLFKYSDLHESNRVFKFPNNLKSIPIKYLINEEYIDSILLYDPETRLGISMDNKMVVVGNINLDFSKLEYSQSKLYHCQFDLSNIKMENFL
jgi:hypothetical protein